MKQIYLFGDYTDGCASDMCSELAVRVNVFIQQATSTITPNQFIVERITPSLSEWVKYETVGSTCLIGVIAEVNPLRVEQIERIYQGVLDEVESAPVDSSHLADDLPYGYEQDAVRQLDGF